MEMQAEDVHFGILLYHALNLLRKWCLSPLTSNHQDAMHFWESYADVHLPQIGHVYLGSAAASIAVIQRWSNYFFFLHRDGM